MSNSAKTKLGFLEVSVDSDSDQLRYNAPVEVRDSKMRVVDLPGSNRNFELQPGLYQVSAVLEDGQEHTRLVEVRSDEKSNIELSAPEELHIEVEFETGDTTKGLKFSRAQSYETPRFTQKIESIIESPPEDNGAVPDAEFIEAKGASLIRQTRKLWLFESDGSEEAVPTAEMRVGDRNIVISLPTSQPADFGPVTCAVRVDYSPTGPRATAWISPERTVANAFMNMLASGELWHAARSADEAVELFRQKYRDPTGATLGALILNKVGRLEPYIDWVENIVADFGWIPDGKVLLASLLVHQRSDLDRAWQLAQEATQARMLYTESYSILLDLLRRWPLELEAGDHMDVLATLAQASPYMDWDSICFSHEPIESSHARNHITAS